MRRFTAEQWYHDDRAPCWEEDLNRTAAYIRGLKSGRLRRITLSRHTNGDFYRYDHHSDVIYLITALVFAGLIAFTTTPMVRMIAFKIGAIDVPRDNRRMHKEPVPRLGGLAIFLAFTLTSLVFCEFTPSLVADVARRGHNSRDRVLDDVFRLHPLIKLGAQIAVAVLAVSQGLTISFINFFGKYINFGVFSIPITILWIVGLTNAINLIDGWTDCPAECPESAPPRC